jgi:hypothetical protein
MRKRFIRFGGNVFWMNWDRLGPVAQSLSGVGAGANAPLCARRGRGRERGREGKGWEGGRERGRGLDVNVNVNSNVLESINAASKRISSPHTTVSINI